MDSKESFQNSVNNVRIQESAALSHNSGSGVNIIFWAALAAAQVVGIICIALVTYWMREFYGGFSWYENARFQFNAHPLLMVLGLIFFYGNAILSYRVLYFIPKWILKIIHAILHLTAAILSIVGIVAVFENRRRTGRDDMYSLHSWVGITAFGFFCLQYIAGFVTFLFPGMPLAVRAQMMPFHTFFGIAIFVLSVGAAEMGINEKLGYSDDYSELGARSVVGNSLGLLLILFACIVIFLATHGPYKRKPLPSDNSPKK